MSKKLYLALIGAGYWGKNLARALSGLGGLKVASGNTIGKITFIGAGTMVTDEVPGYGSVLGNPGKTIDWMCESGDRQEDNPDEVKSFVSGKSYYLKKNKIQPVF